MVYRGERERKNSTDPRVFGSTSELEKHCTILPTENCVGDRGWIELFLAMAEARLGAFAPNSFSLLVSVYRAYTNSYTFSHGFSFVFDLSSKE